MENQMSELKTLLTHHQFRAELFYKVIQNQNRVTHHLGLLTIGVCFIIIWISLNGRQMEYAFPAGLYQTTPEALGVWPTHTMEATFERPYSEHPHSQYLKASDNRQEKEPVPSEFQKQFNQKFTTTLTHLFTAYKDNNENKKVD